MGRFAEGVGRFAEVVRARDFHLDVWLTQMYMFHLPDRVPGITPAN